MTMSPEFRNHVLDLLSGLGPVRAKRMFGGGGLFLDDTMFGLIAGDELYFKTDDGNRAEYEDLGAPAFSYRRGDKTFAMSYHRVPEDCLDDAEDLCTWALAAWEAARRSGTKARKKSKSRDKRRAEAREP